MSNDEGDGLSSRMTNVEIVKYLREKKQRESEKRSRDDLRNTEMRQLRDEINRLRAELGKSSGNSSECVQGSDEEPNLEEEEEDSKVHGKEILGC